MEHARNVFIKYLTMQDEAIKQNSLRVLIKALGLSEEEEQLLQSAQ